MSVGKRILYYLERNEMQQKELAQKINLDAAVLNRIIKGSRPARDNELSAIANVFNISVDELLGRDAPKAIPAKEAPAPPTILMRAEQDLPPEKRKLLEDMAKALLGSDEKIQAAPESSPSSPSTRTSTGRASTRTEK